MRLAIYGLLIIGWLIPSQAVFGQDQSDQTLSDSVGVKLYLHRADSLSSHGELRKAKALLRMAREKAPALDNPSLTSEVTLRLAETYISSDQPDSAQTLLYSMLDDASSRIDSTRILNLLGVTYRSMGQFEASIAVYDSALALVDSSTQPGLFGKVRLNMAMTYSTKADYGRAFKHFLSSIEASEITGDSTALASALNSIGLAYNNYGEPAKGEQYLQRALDINRQLGDRIGLLRATNNLAISYHRQGNFDEAIRIYEEALALHNEVRTETPPFRILYNLGQLYKDTGQLDRAERYYRQSLDYSEEAGLRQGQIYNYGGLANVAELQNNYGQARRYYNRALDISREIGASGLQKIALNSLYELEKGIGNTGDALRYYEEYTALDDSLAEIARQQELAKTETQLSLKQQEEVNQLLQEQQEQQEARIAYQNGLIAGAIIVILIISGLLYHIYRSNEEKKRINTELQTKHQHLEELNDVKDKMLAIIAHDLRSPLSAMHGMLYLMQEEELTENESRQMTTELSLSLNRSITMMDNLLVWARGQMSGMNMKFEAINPRTVVGQVYKDYTLSARQKGIALENEVDETHTVKADFEMMKLIVRNLVSNSIKFCHDGDEINISSIEDGDYIVFYVRDTGIGMSEEIRGTLFHQNGHSGIGTKNEKGTGLGLQLCKEFIEKQHGQIRVESEEGEGTTMVFSLPRA